MSQPFIGSTEKWERPRVSRRRLIDFGCSDAMVSQSTVTTVCEESELTMNVEFANGSTATSIGTTETTVAEDLKVKAIVFENDVLTADLISVSQIVNEKKCDVLLA